MVKKALLIRADASSSIGMGHRIRCQILADEFSRMSWNVRFVSHASCRVLGNESDILIEQEDDFLALAAAADLVILDHYAYDSSMIERLYQVQPYLLLLDDMNDRGALFCRWLLNPVALDYSENLVRLRLEYNQSSILFTGIQYALLRSQFAEINNSRAFAKNMTKRPLVPADKLLITMGGTDPLALTLPILKRLYALGFNCDDLIVMLGGNAKNANEVIHYCQQHNIEYYQSVSDVAGLMARAKMAISAGGSTLFELASIGVPSIFLQVAENQTQLLNDHQNRGWCRVYRLEGLLLAERDRLISQVGQQLLSDWHNDRYLDQAKKKIPISKNINVLKSLIITIIEDTQLLA